MVGPLSIALLLQIFFNTSAIPAILDTSMNSDKPLPDRACISMCVIWSQGKTLVL